MQSFSGVWEVVERDGAYDIASYFDVFHREFVSDSVLTSCFPRLCGYEVV